MPRERLSNNPFSPPEASELTRREERYNELRITKEQRNKLYNFLNAKREEMAFYFAGYPFKTGDFGSSSRDKFDFTIEDKDLQGALSSVFVRLWEEVSKGKVDKEMAAKCIDDFLLDFKKYTDQIESITIE